VPTPNYCNAPGPVSYFSNFPEYLATSYNAPGTYTVTATLFACQVQTAPWVPTGINLATATITITVLPDNAGSGADSGPCAPAACAGSPINLMTGNVWIEHRDYSLPGLGGGLPLVRTWNSQWQDQTPVVLAGMFGHSWRSNYEERLTFPDPNTIKYWRGDGSAWTFAFDGPSQTYLVSLPSDQHARAQFDTNSNLYTITFPDGTRSTFSSIGYLLSSADRNSNQTVLTYDQGNRLTQVTDPAGRSLTFTYNDPNNSGQATSVRDAVGVIATYTYDSSSRLTQVTYADGSTRNFAYDPASSLITSVTDSQGKVLEAHAYDSLHRGLTSTRANGADSLSVDYANSIITDSMGNRSSFDSGIIGGRHFLNNLVGSGCSSCGSRSITSFAYDAQGNRTSSTDSLNHVTSYTYDSVGNVLTKSQPLDNNTTLTWTYTYNQFSEVLTATDPTGHVTTNTYDSNGNLLSTTTPAPDGSHPGSTTRFAYDAKGEPTQITDSLGNVTTIAYTPAGLIASITDAQHNSTSFAYDGRGNRTSVTDALASNTSFTYDIMNRITQTTQPGGIATSFGYDYRGRRTSVTDPNGKVTHYAYDDADHLLSATDASSNVTSYTYDTENNLTRITDASGHATSFSYDARGRVTTVTFVIGGQVHTETYNYDEPGRLLSKTDRNGNTVTYAYDNLDRLSAKRYPDSTAVNYTYDLLSRLTQVADPTGTYSFTYDSLGRLTQTATQFSFLAGQTLTNSYSYDADSNRLSLTNPQGGVTNYVYDSLNRLTSLTDFATRTFGFSYDALGRRTTLTRPNGVNTSYSYDSLSRLLSVLHQTGSTALDGVAYVYDAAGNRISKTSSPSNLTYNFTYDPLYQLSQVVRTSDGKTTEKYTYDAVGDRLSSPGVPYTYNDQHQMTSRERVPYCYDANGNTLSRNSASPCPISGGGGGGGVDPSYTWDFENRLTTVTPANGGVVSFKYDPFGRRIYKNSPSGTTIYVYDGDNIIEELTGTGK
jgi:YD repeat-containing protein